MNAEPPPFAVETDIAKPGTNILVSEHLRRVHEHAMQLLRRHPVAVSKYRELTRKAAAALKAYAGQTNGKVLVDPDGLDLAALLAFCALIHDEGKRGKWSEAAKQGKARLYKLNYRHEIQSAVLCARGRFHPTTQALLAEAGVSGLHADRRYRLWILLAVLAHHGYLGVRQDRFAWVWDPPSGDGSFLRLYEQVRGLTQASVVANNRQISFALKLVCSLPRAYLQLADRKASALESGNRILEWEPFAYQPFEALRDVQRLVKERQDEPYLLVRAGTGEGKTDAALLWIRRQIERGRADRGVFALPTRFTTSALALSAKKGERLSDVGLYHSSALFTLAEECLRGAEERGEKPRTLKDLFSANPTEQDKKTLAALQERLGEGKLLYHPLTATTLDQLLLCLTGTTESRHVTLASLFTSAVVLDEADFYDAFTQEALKVFLEFCRFAQMPVLIMSATLPDFALQAYQAVIPEFQFIEAKQNLDNDQGDLKLHPHPIETKEDWQAVPINAAKALIVYQNTVARAVLAYEHFKALYPGRCVLYHSQFIEADKLVGHFSKLLPLIGPRGAPAHGTAGVRA